VEVRAAPPARIWHGGWPPRERPELRGRTDSHGARRNGASNRTAVHHRSVPVRGWTDGHLWPLRARWERCSPRDGRQAPPCTCGRFRDEPCRSRCARPSPTRSCATRA